ncbi:MAG: proline--tRNA ligase [Elusimicrobia bacterium]|nr:proline--tRNA ligase [Candidatus Obscuribacterium magneticum]
MKVSQFFIPTLKETPSDADTISAKLMLRAGLIRKVASGLYEWLPLGFKVLKRVEQVVREEMDRIGGLEVWLPHVQPKEYWEETGRWALYGKELLRFKDRKNAEFCFAPTAEELITDVVRRDVRSYRELPLLFYQFGTKFRDEIRPRFGVMRAREFYMKDAYSFHADEKDLDRMYQKVFEAYTKMLTRLGLRARPVEAETGTIGGNFSNEFMVLAETGEEVVATCAACGYAANIERAETVPVQKKDVEAPKAVEEVSTPNKFRVEEVASHLKVSAEKIIKTVFYIADSQPVVALLRGDTELNEPKLQRLLGSKLVRPANEEEYRQLATCEVGYAGPMNLKGRLVADYLVPTIVNGVTGANKKDFHLKNVNIGRDFKPDMVGDIRQIRPGDDCPRCGKNVSFFHGIEVGHVFKLGTKYSEAMKATFLDEGGTARPMVMGCYGIGVSRIVAAAIEQNNDENGIRWPVPMAPFEVLITPTNMSEEKMKQAAQEIYEGLLKGGIDVLLDDRDVRAGVKFKDADLIGIPFRLTIGEKSLAKNVVEFKARTDEKAQEFALDKVVGEVIKRVKSLRT